MNTTRENTASIARLLHAFFHRVRIPRPSLKRTTMANENNHANPVRQLTTEELHMQFNRLPHHIYMQFKHAMIDHLRTLDMPKTPIREGGTKHWSEEKRTSQINNGLYVIRKDWLVTNRETMEKKTPKIAVSFGNCTRCFKAGPHYAKCCISKDGSIVHRFAIMEQPWESTRLFATPVVNPISISCLLGYKITEVIDIDLGEYPEYYPATNRDRQPLNLHNLVCRLHATYANHIQKRRTLAHLIDVSFLDLQYIHQDVVNGYTPPNETIDPKNPEEDFQQMFYDKHAIMVRSKTGRRNLKAHNIHARKEDEYQIAVQKHRYLDLYYNSTPSPPNEGPPALHVPTRNARGQARKRRITH